MITFEFNNYHSKLKIINDKSFKTNIENYIVRPNNHIV